jgi:hypothetical protein
MLATLVTCSLVCQLGGCQEPGFAAVRTGPIAEAVAVRGEAELSPADAFDSARRRAEDHVRGRWQDRVDHLIESQRPFWLPAPLAEHAMSRWVADLPVRDLVTLVDREDAQRQHEFGDSWQTTLWVAEDRRHVDQRERQLRREWRRLEQSTAVKYGGIVGGWVGLALLIGWLDRLSRGYMTGRLRLLGFLGGVAVPALAFLL